MSKKEHCSGKIVVTVIVTCKPHKLCEIMNVKASTTPERPEYKSDAEWFQGNWEEYDWEMFWDEFPAPGVYTISGKLRGWVGNLGGYYTVFEINNVTHRTRNTIRSKTPVQLPTQGETFLK
jgi:hypothetical protein